MKSIKKLFFLFCLIPCLGGCGKTTSNRLKFDKYYYWGLKSGSNYSAVNYITIGAVNYIEVTSSLIIDVNVDGSGKETRASYEYEARGTCIFVSNYSQEYFEKNNKNSSVERRFSYAFDYGEGFLKKTYVISGEIRNTFYVTEDFAKDLNFEIEKK